MRRIAATARELGTAIVRVFSFFILAARSLKLILNELGIPWR